MLKNNKTTQNKKQQQQNKRKKKQKKTKKQTNKTHKKKTKKKQQQKKKNNNKEQKNKQKTTKTTTTTTKKKKKKRNFVVINPCHTTASACSVSVKWMKISFTVFSQTSADQTYLFQTIPILCNKITITKTAILYKLAYHISLIFSSISWRDFYLRYAVATFYIHIIWISLFVCNSKRRLPAFMLFASHTIWIIMLAQSGWLNLNL